MNDASPEMLSVFAGAIERPSPAERAAFLDAACGPNVELRQRIDALMRAHDEAGGFLRDRPTASPAEESLDQSTSEGPGTVVGQYKLLEQIGEGGFGVVYMAEQTRPVRRKVALKVLKAGMDTRQVVARFEAERQALAIMDHPNIARVFDGGAGATGRPYFVMELVKGVPITEFCEKNQLTPRQRLELFVPVCQAVQHAHQKGIIHRDLKPSNVLVTVHDTTPVPKVIDFGVAKALGQELTEKTLFTGFAQMVGTPLYMSPEQAGQSGLDVDTRSDIYSLGVLLYELLTGTTPFPKDRFKHVAYDEIRRIIREEEPPRPSTRLAQSTQTLPSTSAQRHAEAAKLTKLVRGELDWIVMKCLEKDRNRRYETAASLVADVRRFLNDEPVQACPPSAWYRFGKFTRRNRREVLVAGAAAVVAATGVAGLAVNRAVISRALESETAAKERERVEAYFQRITVAHHELSADNLGRALKLLKECPDDLREWEWDYLMRLCKVEPLIINDDTEVNGVAFSSPNGERLASAGGDGTIKVWDSRTGKGIRTILAHPDSVVSVAFHPDGKRLASRGTDGTVRVWDLTATDPAVWTEPCDTVRKFGTAYTVAFSADGRLLAAGTEGVVKVWDWEHDQLLYRLPGHTYHSIPVAFSGDGRLATGAFREGLKLWDAETGAPLRTINAAREPVSGLAFSPDNKWLAAVSFRGPVSLSDSTTGEPRCTFEDLRAGNVECVAFSRSGRRLASSGEDRIVHVWDATTGREVLGLRGHSERCGCVAFSPDGRRLASASSDKTIRIWDGTPLRGDEGHETPTFTGQSDEIRSVAVSPDDGQWIASAGGDGPVKVWDVRTRRVSTDFNRHRDFSGHGLVVFGVAWHPKGRRIASAGVDTVRVWDAGTGQQAFTLPAATGKLALPYHAVAFSPDGRYLVTGKVDGAVQVWDAETGQPVGALGTHQWEVRGLAFSRDGEHLASASSDGIIKLWDARHLDGQSLDDRKEARRISRARVAGPGLSVAFSPDGRRLVTGGERNTIKIWEVETGDQPPATLEGHSGEVYAIAVSPGDQGRWLIASGGEDSTVKIWDGRAGKLLRSFRGHTGLVSSLAFSPDGRRLYTGSRDTTVKVWDLTTLSGLK